MSERESAGGGSSERSLPQVDTASANVRIIHDTQVIFADTIVSHAWTPNLSKFYLVRYDSDPMARSPTTQTFVAQVVMPNDGFVKAFAFLEHRLKAMIDGGSITKEALDKARQVWAHPAKA
jgi:hypothetical protein